MLKPNTLFISNSQQSYPNLRTLPILVEVGLDLFVLLKNRDLNRPIVTFPDMTLLFALKNSDFYYFPT